MMQQEYDTLAHVNAHTAMFICYILLICIVENCTFVLMLH